MKKPYRILGDHGSTIIAESYDVWAGCKLYYTLKKSRNASVMMVFMPLLKYWRPIANKKVFGYLFNLLK